MSAADAVRPAPTGLSLEARGFWDQIASGWSLDAAGVLILLVALESFDRMRAAQRAIRRRGLMAKGKLHPATVVERDSRLAMLKALRQLGLDVEPMHPRPGRPGGR